LFYAAVAWLGERRVLLPGVSTLTELVVEVRQDAEDRLYETLAAPVTAGVPGGGSPGGSATRMSPSGSRAVEVSAWVTEGLPLYGPRSTEFTPWPYPPLYFWVTRPSMTNDLSGKSGGA